MLDIFLVAERLSASMESLASWRWVVSCTLWMSRENRFLSTLDGPYPHTHALPTSLLESATGNTGYQQCEDKMETVHSRVKEEAGKTWPAHWSLVWQEKQWGRSALEGDWPTTGLESSRQKMKQHFLWINSCETGQVSKSHVCLYLGFYFEEKLVERCRPHSMESINVLYDSACVIRHLLRIQRHHYTASHTT
jgi:hypothetical protein